MASRAGGPAGGPLDLDAREVSQLSSFLDGAIMIPDVRRRLWRSWGLCPRHAWAYAIAECELRVRPFSTAILYEDLCRRASGVFAAPLRPGAWKLRRLRAHAACFTCEYLELSHAARERKSRVERVNRRAVIGRLVLRGWDDLSARSCPSCAGGRGPVCRLHLLGGGEAASEDLGDALAALSGRLERLVRSMTWAGQEVGPAAASSWVEALGWFSGWETPRRIALEAGGIGGEGPG